MKPKGKLFMRAIELTRTAKVCRNDSELIIRCEDVARYMIETGDTVRGTAVKFGMSKSTVHKEMTTRLRYINYALYISVREVLEKNKAERHLRGGEATKRLYQDKIGK